MRRCTTHTLYRSKLWQQVHSQHPQNANPDGSSFQGTAQCIGRPFGRLLLWSLEWFQERATSCYLTSSKSAWKSTPKCTWMCRRAGDPLVQSGGRWQTLGVAAGLDAGPQVQRDPGLASEGVLRLCTLLSLAPLLPLPEPAGLLRLVIRREHHQHDLPQHQSQPDRRHPPSIRRATAGASGKSMLSVLDPYRGGDWGWRRLHWIDVSSTT